MRDVGVPIWLAIGGVVFIGAVGIGGIANVSEGARERLRQEAAEAGAGYWSIDPVSGEREWKWRTCGKETK